MSTDPEPRGGAGGGPGGSRGAAMAADRLVGSAGAATAGGGAGGSSPDLPTRDGPAGAAPDIAAVAVIALAAVAIARSAPTVDLALAAALAALAAGVTAALAATRPAAWIGALLAIVVAQDAVVAAGFAAAQMADEAWVLAGVAGLALRAMRARGRGGPVPRTPVDLPTLGFAAAGLAGAVVERVPPWVAALGILAVLKGLLAFQLGARAPLADGAAWRGIRWAAAGTAALAAVGLVQRLGGETAHRWTGQAAHWAAWAGTKTPSLLFNHNAFGHAMLLGGALAVGLLVAGAPSDVRRARALRAAAGLALAGLVISGSREAWLAAAAGLAAAAAALRSRRLAWLAAGVAVALAVGGAAVYLGSPFLREELARRTAGVFEGWHLFRLGFTGWAFRGEYRVYIVLKSWQVFLDHPLLGTGPGRFGGAVAARYLSPVYERYAFLPLDGVYIPLDVFWSRLLAESGVLGAACYGAACVAAVRVHRAGLRAGDALTRGLAAGGLMAAAAVAVLGLFSPALEDPLTAIPAWAWAGVVWRRVRAERSAPVNRA